ncbi:hypothetical protein F5B21DRAFT_527259 [Xylaria acuta]|nr:hypothetical protein F5B21DRAFT_527259 [Xylaria acuta]
MDATSALPKGPLTNRNTNIANVGIVHADAQHTTHDPPHATHENASAHSKKRKSDTTHDNQEIPDIDDDDPRLMRFDSTPPPANTSPRSETSSTATISVGATAYQRFMRMRGSHDGEMCNTYPKAFKFFKERELRGCEAKTSEKADQVLEVSRGGRSRWKSPVFETCDEVSQAASCRTCRCRVLDKLTAFMEKKGGSRRGKLKSPFREEMERVHTNGVNVADEERYWICHKSERPVRDKYGIVRLEKFGRSSRWGNHL